MRLDHCSLLPGSNPELYQGSEQCTFTASTTETGLSLIVVVACAVIVEAPGGGQADHLLFRTKDRKSDNGAKPALPLELLV